MNDWADSYSLYTYIRSFVRLILGRFASAPGTYGRLSTIPRTTNPTSAAVSRIRADKWRFAEQRSTYTQLTIGPPGPPIYLIPVALK